MSSLNSPPLSLELRPPTVSVCLGYTAIALGALAPWVFLAYQTALGLSVAAAAILYLGFRLAGWVGAQMPVMRLSWTTEGHWLVEDSKGEVTECELHHTSRVFARCVWLALRPPAARAVRYRLWITRYHLRHSAQLRALIVRLRLDRAIAVPSRLEVHG